MALMRERNANRPTQPLNITHTNLFAPADNERLLKATASSIYSTQASTPLRHTLSTLLNFFAATCKARALLSVEQSY